MNRAVFLDRDGVLIEDVDLLTRPEQLRLLPGVPAGLRRLRDGGFRLVMVSNQAVVARGLATEAEVEQLNSCLADRLSADGAPRLDGMYFCPHHPNATLAAYRVRCECRKPAPGMLMKAASDQQLDLSASFLIGDRLSDITAGARAGCRTVLVQTGKHTAPPIETAGDVETATPDFVCADIPMAADWILRQPGR